MSAWDELVALVNEQAEDEALWSVYPRGTQPIGEAYLQQELRRLHAAVERVVLERLDRALAAHADEGGSTRGVRD